VVTILWEGKKRENGPKCSLMGKIWNRVERGKTKTVRPGGGRGGGFFSWTGKQINSQKRIYAHLKVWKKKKEVQGGKYQDRGGARKRKGTGEGGEEKQGEKVNRHREFGTKKF